MASGDDTPGSLGPDKLVDVYFDTFEPVKHLRMQRIQGKKQIHIGVNMIKFLVACSLLTLAFGFHVSSKSLFQETT